MNKKLILLDIDGTLYDNKNKRVLPSTIEALKKIHQEHTLAIATGRAEFMLYSIAEIRALIDYLILINGQYIIYKDQVIYEDAIEQNLLNKLVKQMDKLNIPYGFEGSNQEAISKIDDIVISSFSGLALNLPPIDPDFHHKHKVYQAWMFCNRDQATFLEKANPEFKFIRWLEYGYDILPKNASKGLGMKRLANYLKIDLTDVVAFGDADNDFEMIKDAGLGIVMGNGTDKVKAVADYITDDVSNDGIYKALKIFKLI